MMNSDQAGAHLSLGVLASQLGDLDGSIKSYRDAIRLDPAVSGPRSNLAQALEQKGQKDEAHQLQLEEVKLLARDAALLPENGLLQYRLGLLQYLLGREKEAETALAEAARLEPRSAEFQLALTLLYEKHKRWPAARRAAARLVELQPDNPTYLQIRENIRRASASKSTIGPPLPSGDR
jgi:tetratricopeptide (TPR) repeat protein